MCAELREIWNTRNEVNEGTIVVTRQVGGSRKGKVGEGEEGRQGEGVEGKGGRREEVEEAWIG